MPADNKATVERWFEEVWNKGRGEAIDEMFPADAVAHGLGNDLRGPAEFRLFHTAFRTAFPDVRVQLEGMIEEGDTVAYRFTATGTHLGDGLGFAATGRPVVFAGMGMARIAGGRIVEGWNVLDQLGMLSQLGVVSPP
jgi:steroid delta-isomerase-like uncharacterized protein